jgi:hypothetical protein
MMAEPLDAEDAKLVVLARSAMARAETGSGAPVGLSALQVTALQTAVAAAVSSGAAGLEAAVPVAGSADDAGIAAVREISATAAVIITDGAGNVLHERAGCGLSGKP